VKLEVQGLETRGKPKYPTFGGHLDYQCHSVVGLVSLPPGAAKQPFVSAQYCTAFDSFPWLFFLLTV